MLNTLSNNTCNDKTLESHLPVCVPNGVEASEEILEALKKDKYLIPKERELYYENDDYAYWLSGFYQAKSILSLCKKYIPVYNVLDFGCASGRLARHLSAQHNLRVWCCDTNYSHINWLGRNIPTLRPVQTTFMPMLPFEDNFFDAVISLSVFTHIEVLDLAWIAEIRRVLKPYGVAYLTVHTEDTFSKVEQTGALYEYVSAYGSFKNHQNYPMTEDKLVYSPGDGSGYSSHVFHHSNYIRRAWGRILNVEDIAFCSSQEQDYVLAIKKW